MTYINTLCADVGTINCPCPLALTGDCLICGRLAGRDCCDCQWAGLCIYNEYIQNGSVIKNRRGTRSVPVLKKIWYDKDLLVLVLKVSKGFALQAASPGAFVFVNREDGDDFSNLPVSVMKADPEKGRLYIALKVISAKTKAVSEAEDSLQLRGVYRNGLLGRGLAGLSEDVKAYRNREKKRWLIITKGIGLAPAVNLASFGSGKVKMDFLIDVEKINEEITREYLESGFEENAEGISFTRGSLFELTEGLGAERAKGHKGVLAGRFNVDDYDRVILLTSDYYIKTLWEYMDIPLHKLVFCNNFRMCCGEGICGACSHIGKDGSVSKMCKCRNVSLEELL